MNNLKIALMQIAPCGSLEKNRQKGIRKVFGDVDYHIEQPLQQPLEQQLQHPVIVNPFAEHGFQNIVLDTVKEVADVHFQNIFAVPYVSVNPSLDVLLSVVRTALRNAPTH